MSNLLIHASSLGKIMTSSKVKSEPLGETCKSHLRDIYIQNTFGRYKDFDSKMIEKGNKMEETGITMLSKHLGTFLSKNETTFKNDFLIGTPDVNEDVIYDIKCPWTMHTYMAADLSTLYEWQGRAYMELCNKDTFTLVYCLTDTPERIIEDEIRRLIYKCGDESLIDDIREGCYLQMTYKDVPFDLKIKTFTIHRDEDKIKQAYEKIELCREYYNTLSLNMTP